MSDPDLFDEAGGQQLRKALGTVNDLEPPTDKLFVQRAIIRGRARTYRRRNAILGAAAAFVVVGGAGGAWWVSQGSLGTTTSASGVQERANDSAAGGSSGGEPALAPSIAGSDSKGFNTPDPSQYSGGPGVAPERDAAGWFAGPASAQSSAVEGLAPELTTTYAAIFSGAWATVPDNSHVTVALVRRDAALESLITAAMPAPSDVEFVVRTHSYADKQAYATKIRDAAPSWQGKGIFISAVTQDFIRDRVVVILTGSTGAADITRTYGTDWVIVTTTPELEGPAPTVTTRPDGSTLPVLPTLQQ